MKPKIHLIIPDLFSPLPLWFKDFAFEAIAPNLSRLLTRYNFNRLHNKTGIDASLFACLGVLDKELPCARYRLNASHQKIVKTGGGVKSFNQQNRSLFCADPVHFEVGMNEITLTDSIHDLTLSEAHEIGDALNDHFSQDGIEFIIDSPSQWYLSIPEEKSITTTPLSEVLGKNIANYQPSSDNRNWQMIQNEVQMLLHSLPLNTQREMQGLPTVNSLWFWGAGETTNSTTNVKSIHSTNIGTGEMLASAAHCKCETIDHHNFSALKLSQLSGNHVYIFDLLSEPSRKDDIHMYQKYLTELDNSIIHISLLSWQAGEIDLIIDGADGNLITPLKKSVWQIWGAKPALLSTVSKKIAH